MATRITNILLAFLVLVSSSGLVFNKHYCRSELKDVSLFVKAENCHSRHLKEEMLPACPMHQQKSCHEDTGAEKGCCNDTSEFLKSDLDQLLSTFSYELPDLPVHWLGLPLVITDLFARFDYSITPNLNYKPPLLFRDFPVSLQTFLC